MKFIPEEIVNRLENEWRQIQAAASDAPENGARATQPADQVRNVVAQAVKRL